MPTIDRIKTEIAFHEKMFFASVAAMLALIGWTVSHYQGITIPVLLLAIAGLVGTSLFGGYQYKRIKKLLMELEKC